MRKIILTESQYNIIEKRVIIEQYAYNVVETVSKEENISLNETHKKNLSKLLFEGREKFYNYLFEASLMDVVKESCLLSFSTENSKIGNMLIFSLPAGWTCPFANKCMKKVERDRYFDPEKIGKTINGKPYSGEVKWERGKETEFDCFAANQEMQYDEVRNKRWSNFDLLKMSEKSGGSDAMADLIIRSIEYEFDSSGKKNEVRIHESGDFYNQKYLDAWVKVAKSMPNVLFYAYSKSLPYFKKYMKSDDQGNETLFITNNFIITFSQGGRMDKDLETMNVKRSIVFNTPEEILAAGLKVDLDDTLAKVMGDNKSSFALLLHGTQAAGEKSKMKMRNETFLNYWKYRPWLNRVFKKSEENIWSSVEAINILKDIESEMQDPKLKISKSLLKDIMKQMNYVIKYEKYNFSPELIEILPEDYQP